MLRRIQIGLTAVIVLSFIALAIEASDNFTVNYGTNQTITAHTECRTVTNDSAAGASVYVPTQTSAEWQSFYTNPPAGVTASSCVTPGSQTFSSPGTYTFTVPAYNTLTVQAWGGGGGGVGSKDGNAVNRSVAYAGSSGGASQWDGGTGSGNPQANGGTRGAALDVTVSGSGGGAGGTGQNCSSASTGQAGGNQIYRYGASQSNPPSGKGGNGASGGAGGASVTGQAANGRAGAAPGGGGSGSTNYFYRRGQSPRTGFPGGGGGGYCARTYSAGTYAPGESVTIVVGAGGAGGNSTRDGGSGGAGRVIVTWN